MRNKQASIHYMSLSLYEQNQMIRRAILAASENTAPGEFERKRCVESIQ